MSQNGIIYIATNLVNGKQYVGQTSKSLKKRINQHIIRKNTHFDHALNKYGLENFYIFKIDYPREELNYWESYYIKMFDTFNTPNGYNHQSGGNVFEVSDMTKKKNSIAKSGENNYWFGKHQSKDHKNKISIATQGHPCLEETKNKISIAKKGKPSPMLGKHHSEETLKKMEDAQKGEKSYWWGKHQSEESNKKRSIINSGENSPNAVLNNEKVIKIKQELKSGLYKLKEIAQKYSVHISTIGYIKSGKLWKHIEV
jgi:Uri superfamily endonuclease